MGARFKQERERLKLSLDNLTTLTHIPLKYLSAIEDGRFGDLPPAKAYRLAYLKEYAAALKLDSKTIIYQFKRENGLDDIIQKHPNRSIRFSIFNSIPFLVRNLIIALLIFLFAGYLIWQIKGVLNPPNLEIYSPPEGVVTNNLNILVQGMTEPECRLMVNGQEIRPNDAGHFEMNIDLTVGVNTITVAAIKKHGKTTTETRHVVVRGI